MTSKQLGLYIATTVILALVLAWVIEKAQLRAFMSEFDQWWEGKASDRKSD